MNEIEIWKLAKLLIEKYGEDAETQADLRADLCRQNEFSEGVRDWTRVLKAIEELTRKSPFKGEPMN